MPDKFYDSAFLDRIHFYIPGWEVGIIRGEMFSDGYGFVVDYLAEILRSLRNHDYSDRYRDYFSLSSEISTRDRDGINKTFSGLMKVLFPDGEANRDEIEELLRFAIEGRKRVKDQLLRIDTTYSSVRFSYLDANGQNKSVSTLEEQEYYTYYHKTVAESEDGEPAATAQAETSPLPPESPVPSEPELQEQHLTFQENQKGISFDTLLGHYLKGANAITVTDPYIRLYYQARNFMELLETVVKHKTVDEEVSVHLVTTQDELKGQQQQDNFEKMQESAAPVGVTFTWEFDNTGTLHARHIVTNHGWKISLDRGLDIFQHYEMNDAFAFANRLQQYRPCKAFEVTYIRHGENE